MLITKVSIATWRRAAAVAMAGTALAALGSPPVAAAPPSAVIAGAVTPLDPLRVSRPFRVAPCAGSAYRGVDLAGAVGQLVVSTLPGRVLFAGRTGGRGLVSVALPGGRVLTYAPVTPGVSAGLLVARGQPLGRLQAWNTGCPAEPCLHWALQDAEGRASDPLVLLTDPKVRLLPWEGLARGSP